MKVGADKGQSKEGGGEGALRHQAMGLSLADVSKAINKQRPHTIAKLTDLDMVPRASTGVFPIDYQTGGGWIRGRINIVWSKEGGGKTLLTYLTIAADQVINPTKKQVIVDAEGRLDRSWLEQLVPIPENVLIIQTSVVEEIIDAVEMALMANDCSVLILDSLAIMVGENELESGGEKAAVGGVSNPVGKLMRKMTARLNQLRALNRYPAVILINQVRQKIGVMYGNPDHQPGGNAPRFMSSLTLWLHSKNEQEKGSAIVNWKATTCTLHKWTTRVLAMTSEYNVCVAPVVDRNTGEILYQPGEVYDWPIVLSELKRLGLFAKSATGKGWDLLIYEEPINYRVQEDLEKHFTDPEHKLEYLKLKATLIKIAGALTHGIPAQKP